MLHKWKFRANTEEYDPFYLDSDGKAIDDYDVIPFIGDAVDARKEADRRADLWENRTKVIITRITYESIGKVGDAKENSHGSHGSY